jgi:competence protein ComEC
MHKSQVFFYLMMAFIVGIFSSSLIAIPQMAILILLIIAIVGLAVVTYQKTFNDDNDGIYKRRILALIFFSIILFSLGAWYFNKYSSSHSFVKEVSDRNIDIEFRGYIDSESRPQGQSQQYVFKVKYIIFPKYVIATDEKILVTDTISPARSYGEDLIIVGKPQMPSGINSAGYANYLKTQDVVGTIAFPKISKDTKSRVSFREGIAIRIYERIYSVKKSFESAISKSLPEPNASFVNGILLGSRQSIPDDLKNDFNKTSTTHILAISGYNIAIVSTYLLALLVIFIRRRWAFWIAVFGIVVFTILTGASASVVRAAIMGILLSFANGYGRLYDQKISISLAALIMILLNPFVLTLDIGFQFSFLSVLGIAYLYPILKEKFSKIKGPEMIKETLLMTLSAQIYVLPLAIYYFNNFSLVSLPVNVLILPFVPFAMALGFLIGISGIFLPLLGKLIGLFAWALTAYQIWIVKFFASLKYSNLIIVPNLWAIIGVYLIIIGITIWGTKSINVQKDV